MHALAEEFPVEDDIARLEPRIAMIEGEFTQLNARLSGVEVDLRDLRKPMDQKLDALNGGIIRLDAKLEARFAKQDERFERQDAKLQALVERQDAKLQAVVERQDAMLGGVLERLDARFKKQDERFERQDSRLEAVLEKLNARIERQDIRLDAAVEKLHAQVDKIDAKFESKLEATSTRWFTFWVAAISAAATIAGAVLAIIFGSPRGH